MEKSIALNKIVKIQNFSRAGLQQNQVQELVKTIQEVGLIHALVVVPVTHLTSEAKREIEEYQELDDSQVVLGAGYNRLAAVSSLGWPTVPCRIYKDKRYSLIEIGKINYIENAIRSKPLIIDSGIRWNDLKEKKGMTEIEIAHMFGIKESTVKSTISNFKSIPQKYIDKIIPDNVKDNDGLITAKKAIKIVRLQKEYHFDKSQMCKMFELCRRKKVDIEILEIAAPAIKADEPINRVLEDALKNRVKKSKANVRLMVDKTAWKRLQKKYGLKSSKLVGTAIREATMRGNMIMLRECSRAIVDA